MFTFVLFTVSGVGIVAITLAKRRESRKKTSAFILRLISLGDERLRSLHHASLRQYSHGKEKFGFWFKKQLPLKAKSLWNRLLAYIRGKGTQYLGDMRGSRLLKRSDGISEFFKNISEIEKGGGEINDTFHSIAEEDFYIQTSEERHAAQTKTAEIIATKMIDDESVYVVTEVPAAKKERLKKPRSPRKKAASQRNRKAPAHEVLD